MASLGVAGLSAICFGQGRDSSRLTLAGDAITLTIGVGESVAHELDLPSGELVEIAVDGRGAMLRVSVDAGGPSIAVRERHAGIRTPIIWAHVTEQPTALVVRVTSLETAGPPRSVSIRLALRRPAGSSDAARAAATRSLERAEQLERSGAAEMTAVIADYTRAATQWGDAREPRHQAASLFEVGRLLLDAGRPAEAVDALNSGIAACRAAADSACEATGLHRLGRHLAVTGSMPQGIEALEQARQIRERRGDEAGQAETLMEIGGAEATRSQSATAEIALSKAVALARASGDRRTEADALNMHAVLRSMVGDVGQSRVMYESALAIRRAVGDTSGQAQTTSNLGVLLRGLGEPRRALVHYQEALAIRRRLGAAQPIANTLHNLGVAHADLGEHERGLELFREALDLWRSSGGRRGEAFTLQAIGQSYARLGEPAKALEHFALCTPLWKAVGDRRGEAQTLLAAAEIHAGGGGSDRAMASYADALALARAAGFRREVGMALVGRAAVARRGERLDDALADAREARAIFAEIGERREEGRAHAEIAASYLASGRAAEADASYREALAAFASVEDRIAEAGARLGLARTAERLGRALEARAEALTALDLVESSRAGVSAEGLSVSFLASKRAHYDETIALLQRLHDLHPTEGFEAAALAVSERLRGRSLLDLLVAGEVTAGDTDDPALADIARLQESINGKATRLTRLLSAAARSSAVEAAARRELDDLLTQLDSRRAELRSRRQGLGVVDARPLALAEIQQRLADRGVLIEYALGDERSYGWVVTATSHTTFSVPRRSEIERLTRRALRALGATPQGATQSVAGGATAGSATAGDRAALEALSEALVAPAVQALLGPARVFVVADGVLQSLPFAALAMPGRGTERLGDARDVAMLPSFTVGAALGARAAARVTRPPNIVAIVDPVFSSDDGRLAQMRPMPLDAARWPRLRFSRAEADAIARLAPRRTTVHADLQANRSALVGARLDEYDVLHVATHAVIDHDRPALSSIVLSQVDRGGRSQDGLVRLHEIYGLKLNARLVVLSACRTALGRPVDGEGVLGLARGFLFAGADAVVATLWDVDDRATAAFMGHFYRALLADEQPPATALRTAQRLLRRDSRFSHPRDWAAFVVIGSGMDPR